MIQNGKQTVELLSYESKSNRGLTPKPCGVGSVEATEWYSFRLFLFFIWQLEIPSTDYEISGLRKGAGQRYRIERNNRNNVAGMKATSF
jgi:hypothetical protein